MPTVTIEILEANGKELDTYQSCHSITTRYEYQGKEYRYTYFVGADEGELKEL